MWPLHLHLLAYFEPSIIPCWLGISTGYITSLSITYCNLKSACSPTYGKYGWVSRPLLIFQIGTNNWQRQGEFAPGSGILHASFHQTMNSISTSRLPREFQRRQNSHVECPMDWFEENMRKKYQESMVLTTFYYVVTICYHQTLVVAGRFPLFEAVSLFSGASTRRYGRSEVLFHLSQQGADRPRGRHDRDIIGKNGILRGYNGIYHLEVTDNNGATIGIMYTEV